MKEKPTKPSILSRIFKRRKLTFIILVSLIVAVVIGSRIIANKRKNAGSSFEIIRRGTVSEELILSGEINADQYASLGFPVSGKIRWFGVVEGDMVKEGQALVKLDTTQLSAAYLQAEANLRSAQASLDSVYDQVKGHKTDESYTQRATRTTYEAAKDVAYRSYESAKYALNNATIYAPFSGIATSILKPYLNTDVFYTDKIVEVINPQTIYFDVTADQNEVTKIKPDTRVTLTLDPYENETFQGRVIFVSFVPRAGGISASYKVKVGVVDVDLTTTKFRVGMTGDAKFVLSEKTDVLYVSPKFIKSDKKGKYVNLERVNNKVYIVIGIEGEDATEIIGDIKEGQKVFD